MFLIVWIVKPKYFPFFKQNAIPSRWTVLGITAVIYIILSMLLVLTLANYDGASVTDFELIVMLFSILLLINVIKSITYNMSRAISFQAAK